jgi:hypothetical protein
MAVVNFQRAGHYAFLPQGDHQHGVNFRGSVGFIIVFNDDFPVINRLSGGGANGVIVVAIVVLTHTHVGQHVIDIRDRESA